MEVLTESKLAEADRKLFYPLVEHFMKNPLTIEMAEEIEKEIKVPDYVMSDAYGISIYKPYVRKHLTEFCNKYGILKPTRFKKGKVTDKHYNTTYEFGTGSSGAILFRSLNDEHAIRVDNVFEYKTKRPVIVDISMGEGYGVKFKAKTSIVSSLYNTESFFLKIRPYYPGIPEDKLGLNFKEGLNNHRKILTNNITDILRPLEKKLYKFH